MSTPLTSSSTSTLIRGSPVFDILEDKYLDAFRERLEEEYHPVIQEFKDLIENNADLYMGFHQMFEQIPNYGPYQTDVLGNAQVRDYETMLRLFNDVLSRAPALNLRGRDMTMTPIGVILSLPMTTPAGVRIFTNEKVNAQMKKVLNTWGQFLSSPESLHVLTTGEAGWFGPLQNSAIPNLVEVFQCDPTKSHHGFTSWDDFFTRRFRSGVRPIAFPNDDAELCSACESIPYRVACNVQLRSPFWVKGETYSLWHMLNNDPLTTEFVGGTVYQAFLSAFTYHRWHSPVNGTVIKTVHVPGTYYATSPSTTLGTSQVFVTNIATRTLVFIEADNPAIGLLCFIAVGLAEISSCEATVKGGDRVKKGDEIGMFHFGGSTHCLVFRPEAKIAFHAGVQHALQDQKTMLLVNAPLGRVMG
ncbi:hypothetical protein P691DRAFT_798538 [Macrolepiota fuliginosa MF-IS2]|uniref:L-tryptophan decarboxylase PsiD-like domain-containing protein n=1 Tax=Macrolepiota fuliginosa MF-IS2 TaxID=1400762 RepID=A0A9P6BYA8_9AGAR|nr:hypothetical protein P691DRAFT_798538 [Macrolepiota fuliginosa MF-IS2]